MRPVFREAARLGLLAAGASTGGPLGQALSAAAQEDLVHLLEEMRSAGLSFRLAQEPEDGSPGWEPPLDRIQEKILDSDGDWAAGHRDGPSFTRFEGDELVVSGRGLEAARVTSLYDLQALDAFTAGPGRRTDHLPDPALAGTLRRLEEAGVEFRLQKGAKSRAVGAYGAYRALTGTATMAPTEAEMLRAARPGTETIPATTREKLEPLRFFTLGEAVPELEGDARAQALRCLEEAGCTFHYRWEKGDRRHSAAEVWEQIRQGHDPMLQIGVCGGGIQDVTVEQLLEDSGPPAGLADLSRYYVEHLSPRLAAGELTARAGDLWMQALARPVGGLAVEGRGAVLDRLYRLEQAVDGNPGTGDQTARRAELAGGLLERLSQAVAGGWGLQDALEEIELLRRAVPRPEVALEAVGEVLLALPGYTFGAADLAEQRDRLVRTARLASSFEQARQALELLETTLPFEEGAALLDRLVALHQELQPGVDSLPEAMEDYKLVLRHRSPEESPGQAFETLRALHRILLPREGCQAGREAFRYLQHGWSRGAFPCADKEEAVRRFLESWVLSPDAEAAREAVRNPGAGAGRIVTDEDQVIVGGVPVKRRRN
ncbi:MAG: hypothetical protein HY319_12395 [Armatimonadetes bacterium]|nr:hypothetical protein [Armatimonadota bacterium]